MGISLKGLKTISVNGRKQTREIINSPQGMIEIYEPTREDIAEVINLQRNGDIGEDGQIIFDGVTVIRKLFPLLTNIDLNITDEEMIEVVNNPSIYLLMAQESVSQIISECNKLYMEKLKTQLINAESTVAQVELLSTIPSMLIENAKGKGETAELAKKVEEVNNQINDIISQEEDASEQEL